MPIAELRQAPSPSGAGDATVYVATPSDIQAGPFAAELAAAKAVDAAALGGVGVFPSPAAAGGRLVFSPTGPLNREYDDVRRVADAAAKGVRRAVAAGATAPCVYLPASVAGAGGDFAHALTVALAAALGAVYAPLSVRTFKGEAAAERVGVVHFAAEGVPAGAAAEAARVATALELGRRVAKDVGGGDPEVMAPPRCAEYVAREFAGLQGVTVSVEDDAAAIAKAYPLAAAVARASLHVPRHAPRVVRLAYEGAGPINKQLYLIGE